jgi:hypothetical protein
MRLLQFWLDELAKSKEYRRDYNELKRKILQTKMQAVFKYQNYAQKYNYPDHRYERVEILSLERVQDILRNGNINDHLLDLPILEPFLTEKWGLRLFFDPTKDYPKGFDPFDDNPITGGKRLNSFEYRVYFIVDLRFLTDELVEDFKSRVELFKRAVMTPRKRERKAPYITEEEIDEVRRCLKRGIWKNMEIFRILKPEYGWYHPGWQYKRLSKEDNVRHRDAHEVYTRISRLVRKERERLGHLSS